MAARPLYAPDRTDVGELRQFLQQAVRAHKVGGQDRRARYASARDDLREFMPLVVRTDTGEPAIPPRHLRDIILPTLMDDSLGHTVIVAPPNSAKTTATIAAMAHRIGHGPSKHYAYVCDTDTQAQSRSVAVRALVSEHPRYREMFPDVVADKDLGWGEAEWFLERDNIADKDPTMRAVGVGGSLLGARLDFAVLDDIANTKNMNTKYQQDKLTDWLDRVFMTRLNPGARVVMIATRWAVGDPVAWAIKQGWTLVHLDALTDDGDSYWPERFPIHTLMCPDGLHDTIAYERELPGGHVIKDKACYATQVGERTMYAKCTQRRSAFAWTQQYRGVVYDDAKALIRREYWQRYPDLPPNTWGGIFVDMAHTEDQENDPSVVGVVLTDGVNVYVVDWHVVRLEYPDLSTFIQTVRVKWPHLGIYVEETPGSKPLLQALWRTTAGVNAWKHEGRSKLARVQASLPFWTSGNVHVPDDAPWVLDLIEECAAFPMGEHDDQVDVMTMALDTLAQPTYRWGPA